MIFSINQESSSSFQVLVDANVQSFFLGIAAILVLIIGSITFIRTLIKDSKKNQYNLNNFKDLNSNEKEIIKLLMDLDEIPEDELSNLISITGLKENIRNLEKKGFVNIKSEDDINIIILNKEKFSKNK